MYTKHWWGSWAPQLRHFPFSGIYFFVIIIFKHKNPYSISSAYSRGNKTSDDIPTHLLFVFIIMYHLYIFIILYMFSYIKCHLLTANDIDCCYYLQKRRKNGKMSQTVHIIMDWLRLHVRLAINILNYTVTVSLV